jgi:alkanesulfonate monooxygenase SsuD/methylene tetrahydromethanopterin reductase-like flavin-dependent oxidoreductase (luciferase family)
MRNPPIARTTMADRIGAALDMTAWADRLGFANVTISEHHGSADGYLPSAVTMAAAMAARTETIHIMISALVAPLYDPLRLAEELAVAELISKGRIDVVLVNGYVASEFAMFGRELSERAKRTTEAVHTLRKAWTGEPFEYEGKMVHVTPAPSRPGSPSITLGGSTEAAARRAARIADSFQPTDAQLWPIYQDELAKLGKPDPGPYWGGDTSFFHLAHDKEKAWAQIAPYGLHEMNAYGQWMDEAGLTTVGGYRPVADADALRETGQYRVITPDEMVAQLKAAGPAAFALFHPLMGGIPPELGWESLHLFEHEVLPQLGE